MLFGWKGLHELLRVLGQMEELEAREAEILRIVEILFFLIDSIHALGGLRDLVLLAKIDGEETIIIDLEQDWILTLVSNLLAQGQHRARDCKEVHIFDPGAF